MDNIVAQNLSTDTIKKTVSLNEVAVTADNITRVDGYVLILPDKRQQEHASSGYGVLKNLMLPGLTVDMQHGKVEVMGMEATLYINGVACDSKDALSARQRNKQFSIKSNSITDSLIKCLKLCKTESKN